MCVCVITAPVCVCVCVIGGEGKYRATTSLVTHISSADIAELVEEDGGRGKHPDILRAVGVSIYPGVNKILLSGKVIHIHSE